MLSRIALALCLSCTTALPALAADAKREALYDITGDFDHDGKQDRAVLILVGPGNSDTSDLEKDRYGLGDDERVDLAIYFGAGDAPLDITKKPDFEKDNIADQSRQLNWVVPLEVNKAGALKLTTIEGYGSSHEDDEVLTLRINGGVPTIIGYDYNWETRDGSEGCSIDLLKGNAIRDVGGSKKHLKVKAEPIALKDWKQPVWDKICDPD